MMPLPKNNLFYGKRPTFTSEQEEYVDNIIDYHVVMSNSKAGSGKTTLALGALKILLDDKKIDAIYYVFAPIEEGEMGFRPGTQQEKEIEYTQPLKDALIELGYQPEQAMRDKTGWVKAVSHTFMRGTNKKRVGMILDEAQNWQKKQLRKVLTRMHDDSHAVVIGHTGQCDLKNESMSGFQQYIDHMSKDSRVKVVNLTKNFRGWIAELADSIDD